MPSERVREIVQELESSQQEFATATAGLSDMQAALKPAEGGWSALDCTEHVGLVEDRFRQRLETAGRNDAPRVDRQREADLAAKMGNRTSQAQAPEAVQPTGRFGTLAEALAYFASARAKTVQFAQTSGEDLHSLSVEHPRFGALTGAELLMLVSFHTRRHAEQVRETLRVIGVR